MDRALLPGLRALPAGPRIGRWTWRELATLWIAAAFLSFVILVGTTFAWPQVPDAWTFLTVLLSPEYFTYLLRADPAYIVAQFVIPIAAAAITMLWLFDCFALMLMTWSWRPIVALWVAAAALSWLAPFVSKGPTGFATCITAFWLSLRLSSFLSKADHAR